MPVFPVVLSRNQEIWFLLKVSVSVLLNPLSKTMFTAKGDAIVASIAPIASIAHKNLIKILSMFLFDLFPLCERNVSRLQVAFESCFVELLLISS